MSLSSHVWSYYRLLFCVCQGEGETMRQRVYVEAFEEHSTYSSMIFLVHLVQAFPMPIECVQTDNGAEFTKRFTKARLDEDLTLFERK